MPDEDIQDPEPGQRPFWSGTIAFGLVSVPVSLVVASRSAGISLRMVDSDGTPLSRRYLCGREERLLEPDEIVRGYAVDEDRYVTVDDEELAALAPDKSREIDLKRFVPLAQIDPIYFERAYFLVPDRGAIKAYRLLARTMEDVQRAGIATFVMRGKEYLVAIIGERGLLRAETLRFADEVRTPADVGIGSLAEPEAKRVREMTRAIRQLSADTIDPDLLRDPYRERLLALVERKLEDGTDVVAGPEAEPEEESEGAEVIDLMQVLKQSLQGRRRTGSNRTGGDRQPLAQRSKTELYRRAQELGIAGRSRMSKEELVEAISAAD